MYVLHVNGRTIVLGEAAAYFMWTWYCKFGIHCTINKL